MRQDIKQLIAKDLDLSCDDARVLADSLTRAIQSTLLQGNDAWIKGLGTFTVVKSAERRAADITDTKRVITIAPQKQVKFTPCRTFKLLVRESE